MSLVAAVVRGCCVVLFNSWEMVLAGAGLASWGGGVGVLLSAASAGCGSPGAGRVGFARASGRGFLDLHQVRVG